MKITVEDLKKLSEIYEPVMERADELLKFQSGINGEHRFSVDSIYDITDEEITFYCSNYRSGTDYKKFNFSDFVSDDYFDLYKKQYEETLEKKRIEKERIEEQRKVLTEAEERKTLEMLKAKYPNG